MTDYSENRRATVAAFCLCHRHEDSLLLEGVNPGSYDSQFLHMDPEIMCDLITHVGHFAPSIMLRVVNENGGNRSELHYRLWENQFTLTNETARVIGKFIGSLDLDRCNKALASLKPWNPQIGRECFLTGQNRKIFNNNHTLAEGNNRKYLSNFLLRCGGLLLHSHVEHLKQVHRHWHIQEIYDSNEILQNDRGPSLTVLVTQGPKP